MVTWFPIASVIAPIISRYTLITTKPATPTIIFTLCMFLLPFDEFSIFQNIDADSPFFIAPTHRLIIFNSAHITKDIILDTTINIYILIEIIYLCIYCLYFFIYLRFGILRLWKMYLPGQLMFSAPLLSHFTHSKLLEASVPVNNMQGLLCSQHQSPIWGLICRPRLLHLHTKYTRLSEVVTKLYLTLICTLQYHSFYILLPSGVSQSVEFAPSIRHFTHVQSKRATVPVPNVQGFSWSQHHSRSNSSSSVVLL